MAASGTLSAALIGCTGLVGSHILKTLLSPPVSAQVQAIARRDLPESAVSSTSVTSLKTHVVADSQTWPQTISAVAPGMSTFISALGSTRAQAGSVAAQRRIDLDLNLACARAAREAGVATYVLVSSGGSSSKSHMAYLQMKGQLEDEVQQLGFEHVVILRPGLLLGQREDHRLAEAMLRSLANGMGKVLGQWSIDFWAQSAEVVARAAVAAARECAAGKREKGTWRIEQADVVRLGRTEWKD